MSTNNTFRELAIEQAPKQKVMVDAVTEDAPFLASLPMEATSNGIQNVYEEIKDIDGAQFVSLDESLPSMGVDTELQYVDLSSIGGKIEIGEDKARIMGGKDAYFAKKLPPILRDTGAKTEQSIIYNNFRAYAKANGKLVSAGGSNDGNMYSMIAITFKSGEITGLYDSEGFGNGEVFDMQSLNGGNLYDVGSGVLGYGMRIKNYMGIQLANDRYVAGIANIDLAKNGATDTGYEALPTEIQIDEMLLNCRAGANTVIVCHPAVLTALQVYKGDRLEVSNSDTEVNRKIMSWNGVPIIPTWNMLTTEATEA